MLTALCFQLQLPWQSLDLCDSGCLARRVLINPQLVPGLCQAHPSTSHVSPGQSLGQAVKIHGSGGQLCWLGIPAAGTRKAAERLKWSDPCHPQGSRRGTSSSLLCPRQGPRRHLGCTPAGVQCQELKRESSHRGSMVAFPVVQ